jgi:hypothetical protein
MPLPHSFDLTRPPLGERRCPMCGLPMFLSRVEPSDKTAHDNKTFECSTCAYAETMTVEFR